MMKWTTLFFIINWTTVHSRIVFKPGSDVGYILPDPPEEDLDEIRNPLITKFINDEEVKNEVKRAFWNSLVDGFSDTLSKQSTPYAEDLGLIRRSDQSTLTDLPERLKDDKHGVTMGISDHRCDDAKSDLQVDWDGSPVNHTCYSPKLRLLVNEDVPPIETCDDVPPNYVPKHYCMSREIHYNTSIPTFGPHRPLWAVFGEYQFLPPHRWLHNIEHGSVVMLYHPCTEPLLVLRLKELVKDCIYKHVITPSTLTALERPMVLVSWGCKLEMATVDEEKVVSFIRDRALKGPEGNYTKQGTFTNGLLHKSSPPPGSDLADSYLCPNF